MNYSILSTALTLTALLGSFILICAGCVTPQDVPSPEPTATRTPEPATPEPEPTPPPPPETVAAPAVAVEELSLGRSVDGRPLRAKVFTAPDPRATVLILATIHGDEAAGTPLLKKLADHVLNQPDLLAERKLILVPEMNPDGHARRRRYNTRGVDLNRNFPAENWKRNQRHGPRALSEPESRALHRLLQEHEPDWILSFHQPVGCLDYDGPGAALARHLAGFCDLPVRKLGGRPGSLGSYAGETLGIPILTVELPGVAGTQDAETLWDRYGEMLLASLRYEPAAP